MSRNPVLAKLELLQLAYDPEGMGFSLSEPEFHASLLFWDKPTIDANAIAYNALFILGDMGATTNVESLVQENRDVIERLLSDNFDRDSGGFAHAKGAWSSIYGIFFSLCLVEMLAREYQYKAGPSAALSVNREALARILGVSNAPELIEGFVWRCYKRTGERADLGAFSEYPGSLLGLITSSAAIKILQSLGAEIPPEDFKAMRKFAAGCWRKFGSRRNTYRGIANSPESDKPNSDCLKYSYDVMPRGNESDALELITRCHNTDGGFASQPGGRSDIYHTRRLLAAYHYHFQKSESDQLFAKWAQRAVSFLHQWAPNYRFGFTTDSRPNILAIRDAASVVSLLAQTGHAAPMPDLDKMVAAVMEHYDERQRLFVGYADLVGSTV